MAPRRGSKKPSITLEEQGLKELRRKLQPELYAEAVEKIIKGLVTLGWATAGRKAPYFTGALKRSIHAEAKPTMGRVFSNLNYAVPVEYGRSPNRTPPPVGPLRRWASKKGINVYALAKSIGRRGIKGRFFMKAALEAMRIKAPVFIRVASADIAKRWSR